MGGGVPHLHVASGFSARFGASHPSALVARAAERGIGTVALTDRDNVTGAVRFAKAAGAAGVRPVFGADPRRRPTPARLPGDGAPAADPGPRRRARHRGAPAHDAPGEERRRMGPAVPDRVRSSPRRQCADGLMGHPERLVAQ